MSAYDTIDRDPRWWVRVYCEVPMGDPDNAVMLEVGDRDARLPDGSRNVAVECMTPEQAVRIATALLNAAARAKHQLKVEAVLKGTR